MKISELNTHNCEYDAAHWIRRRAMYTGGKSFREHIREFLPCNPVESDERWQARLREASYENHVGPIIDYFVSWLFSMSFSVKMRAKDDPSRDLPLPDFYQTFHADVGDERSLPDFVKDRTGRALAIDAAFTLFEKPQLPKGVPQPENKADFEAAGLGKIRLKSLEREQVLDWAYGDDGHYDWIVVYNSSEVRGFPAAGGKLEIVHQWRIYDRQAVHLHELRLEKGQHLSPEEEANYLGATPHGFKRVPVLKFELPEGLRAGERTYEPQLEHFRLCSGLAWSIRQTCYAMPVISCENDEAPPRMGIGNYVQIGVNDKFGWSAPPSAPYDVIQKSIDKKREEIYRVNHSMAQALDNNAETVGRSADSKNADSAAQRIVLNALGQEVCKFIKKLYETLSETRLEDDITWSIEGFSGYDTTTAGSLLSNAEAANRVGIPSKKFKQEINTKIAMALLPEADQTVKDTIRQEIGSFDFQIHDPMDALNSLRDAHSAKADLDEAKAAAEPIKAQAAKKSAERPTPSPNGGPKATAPQPKA